MVRTHVSPGFMPRPSLSAHTHTQVSPGFMPRPSLSVDASFGSRHCLPCVAGVYAPAFVERGRTNFRNRCGTARVAGVYAPAFVER